MQKQQLTDLSLKMWCKLSKETTDSAGTNMSMKGFQVIYDDMLCLAIGCIVHAYGLALWRHWHLQQFSLGKWQFARKIILEISLFWKEYQLVAYNYHWQRMPLHLIHKWSCKMSKVITERLLSFYKSTSTCKSQEKKRSKGIWRKTR